MLKFEEYFEVYYVWYQTTMFDRINYAIIYRLKSSNFIATANRL